MTDPQTPRPTLKLNLKPAILESLADRIPKQTIVIPEKPVQSGVSVKGNIPNKQVSSQTPAANKPVPTPPENQQERLNKKPKQAKKVKDKTPPPVLIPYDFFEVYGKLHTEYREVISLKNPKALAIGIDKDIRQATGLSKKNNNMWIAEYLRRSLYYKRGHIAGANRYNLQGEITGAVTQEQYEAGQAIFRKVGRRLKKAQQSLQETNQ